jgi:hypothetical protein
MAQLDDEPDRRSFAPCPTGARPAPDLVGPRRQLEESVMAPRSSFAAMLAAIVLAVAACSGGASTAPGTSTGTGPGSSTGSQPSQPDSQPTDAAAQPTDDDSTGGTGTFSGSACDLLTTAEVGAAAGQPAITASETKAGDFQGQSQCGYVSNGLVPVVILTVLNDDGQTDPEAMLTTAQAKRLDVNGAKAYWIPSAGFAGMVAKNGHIVLIAVLGPGDGHEPDAIAQALVQPIADRMP